MTEVGSDLQQTLEAGTLVIEEGDGTTITVTQATDDDNEVRPLWSTLVRLAPVAPPVI